MNEFIARKGLVIKNVQSGTTIANKLLAQDSNGLIKYRTDLEGLLPQIGNTGEVLFRDTGATYGYNTTSSIYISGGEFYADVKHFRIQHPSEENKYLVYSSVESPFNGVQLNGYEKITTIPHIVNLPEYLNKLIYSENVNIQITPYKQYANYYIEEIDIDNNLFKVSIQDYDNKDYEFFWILTGERKDIDRLVIEQLK